MKIINKIAIIILSHYIHFFEVFLYKFMILNIQINIPIYWVLSSYMYEVVYKV